MFTEAVASCVPTALIIMLNRHGHRFVKICLSMVVVIGL